MNTQIFNTNPFETGFRSQGSLESFAEFAEDGYRHTGYGETETEDREYGSALNILSPSELKAVKITSTFETGRAGGFGGLSANFDGQGLSFGLMNFTIKAGSLIPLLQEFINNHPTNYSNAFGRDAERFKQMVFATKPDPQNPKRRIRDVERQMEFVNTQMNSIPRQARGNKIVEPWKTYFGRLEVDPEFQKIQVKAVRNALNRARYWCWYFEFKTERGFVFMFDLVSSHGGAWLNAPKFKGARRVLLRKMLADKRIRVGRDTLTELEKMEVIANMIADASSQEWREKVRVRKLWFVQGIAKVHGTLYDIKKDFGVTDNAPDFGGSASTQPEAAELTYETSTGRGSSPTEPPGQTILDTRFPLGSERPAAVQTGIFIPYYYQARPEVDLIIYLHGHKIASGITNSQTISQYWIPPRPFLLREALNDSGKNAVLVAPSLGPYSEAGKLTEPGGFDLYIDTVLQILAETGPNRGTFVRPAVGNIVLACHSGGGKVMRRLVQMTHRYSSKIRECWGFDCLYDSCDAAVWRQWGLGNPSLKLFIYYLGSTSVNSRDLEGKGKPAIPPPANVTVEPSSTPNHGKVPTTYLPALLQRATFLSSKWPIPFR